MAMALANQAEIMATEDIRGGSGGSSGVAGTEGARIPSRHMPLFPLRNSREASRRVGAGARSPAVLGGGSGSVGGATSGQAVPARFNIAEVLEREMERATRGGPAEEEATTGERADISIGSSAAAAPGTPTTTAMAMEDTASGQTKGRPNFLRYYRGRRKTGYNRSGCLLVL